MAKPSTSYCVAAYYPGLAVGEMLRGWATTVFPGLAAGHEKSGDILPNSGGCARPHFDEAAGIK
jgi:hypothetical protein